MERPIEPFDDLVDSLHGFLVRGLHVAVQERVTHDADDVSHVVEDKERGRHHEHRLRYVDRVVFGCRKPLEVFHCVVGDVPHHTAVERPKIGNGHQLVGVHRPLNGNQGVDHPVRLTGAPSSPPPVAPFQ